MKIDAYELSEGCSCKVAPGWGCNLFSWKVDGTELMYCPHDLPAKAAKITGGGNPILFPAVGRTWDRSSGQPVQGNYRIHGSDKTYFMPSHGILFLCTFEKTCEDRAADRITAAYELHVPERVRSENYPFDLGMTHRFTLSPTSVELEAVIANKGSVPAPAAFGYHPYFRVSNPRREGVEVRMPVTKHLRVSTDTLLLTGESDETDGILKLEAGVDYDNVFGDPTGRRMSLMDRKAGHAVHVDFDEKCELFLVYTPAGSDFVCIEPWTRGLGGFEQLRNPGWESGGFVPVLKPGEIRRYGATFSVSHSLPE